MTSQTHGQTESNFFVYHCGTYLVEFCLPLWNVFGGICQSKALSNFMIYPNESDLNTVNFKALVTKKYRVFQVIYETRVPMFDHDMKR